MKDGRGRRRWEKRRGPDRHSSRLPLQPPLHRPPINSPLPLTTFLISAIISAMRADESRGSHTVRPALAGGQANPIKSNNQGTRRLPPPRVSMFRASRLRGGAIKPIAADRREPISVDQDGWAD